LLFDVADLLKYNLFLMLELAGILHVVIKLSSFLLVHGGEEPVEVVAVSLADLF
jgi:hypothetical protein